MIFDKLCRREFLGRIVSVFPITIGMRRALPKPISGFDYLDNLVLLPKTSPVLTFPACDVGLAEFRKKVQLMLQQRRKDPGRWNVLPFPITYQSRPNPRRCILEEPT